MLKDALGKTKYIPVPHRREDIKGDQKMEGIAKCPSCSRGVPEANLVKNYKVCPHCAFHYPLTSRERINLMVDTGTFKELDANLDTVNMLDFPGYDEKLANATKQTGLKEAIITGQGCIGSYPVALGVMDSRFLMASMGSVVGEKVCRLAEKAIDLSCPLIICAASGGARMQEGILSLMQMAKTSAVLQKFHQAGLLYISILTHPTTGGVSASFASLADIIIAEPGALVGFTGPRVIQQTIKQRLPENFQRSEFLLQHGMVDMVIERTQLNSTLQTLLKVHQGGTNG